MSKKMALVVGINPDTYKIGDKRFRKPVWHQKFENGKIVGSGLLQELDQLKIGNSCLTYFQPNNIALLLSISQKSLDEAKLFYKGKYKDSFCQLNFENYVGNKKIFISERSSEICNYIEQIQISIVFSYSAVEAFSNISIPDNFKYAYKKNKKCDEEILDKSTIERWIPLKDKIGRILPDIYKVKKPTLKKWWSDFIQLENLRHNIIHQKSIDSTEFYKKYFQENIFTICSSAFTVIKYFYDETAKQNRTHVMWPWLSTDKSELPISFEFDSLNVEVIGNLFEGIKNKGR
jgi:hypothetical protein